MPYSTENNLTNIKSTVKSALDRLYTEDLLLFTLNEGEGVSERCIVFRFAMYLQEHFTDYYIDCDFNASWNYELSNDGKYHGSKVKGKWIDDPDGSSRRRFPDIIVHKRDYPEEYDPFGNEPFNDLICLEIKKSNNYDTREREKDLNVLQKMTSSYTYQYGFHLILHKNKEKTKWTIFKDGKPIEENTGVFENQVPG